MSAFTEREALWGALARPWDLIIIGGGITGASVLREATRAGLKALLVEQRDFAWGTSSRSSKLVHGGLRYLANGDVPMVRAVASASASGSCAEGNGLVKPLDFMLASHPKEGGKHWQGRAGIFVYELLTGRWPRGNYAPPGCASWSPRSCRRRASSACPMTRPGWTTRGWCCASSARPWRREARRSTTCASPACCARKAASRASS